MPSDVELPRPPFLYTLDQVSQITQIPMAQLLARHVWFARVSTGRQMREQVKANSISALGDPPDWRVEDLELKRWLKALGFRLKPVKF